MPTANPQQAVRQIKRIQQCSNSVSSNCGGFVAQRTDVATTAADKVKYTTNVQRDKFTTTVYHKSATNPRQIEVLELGPALLSLAAMNKSSITCLSQRPPAGTVRRAHAMGFCRHRRRRRRRRASAKYRRAVRGWGWNASAPPPTELRASTPMQTGPYFSLVA